MVMPICAIYARVSDEEQVKGESIDHQISFMREFAKRRGEEHQEPWATPEQFILRDEGISGTSIIRRPAVQKLIHAAKQRQFDIVLFRGISRFARDTVDALVMLRTLQACGVRVISFEESFDSFRDNAELIFTMHSAVAQYESEKIGIRVKLGNLEKAKQGKWCGSVPDGYKLDKETKHLHPDPLRASIIQDIFRLYEQGYGTVRICGMLNEQGIRSANGALWNFTRVRRILRNSVYCGDVIYGMREQVLAPPDEDNPLNRRYRTVMTKDISQVAVCRDAHEALITRQQYQRVQDVLAKRKTKPGRTSLNYLLIGVFKCKCGSPMNTKHNGRGTRYYRCRLRYTKGYTLCDQGYVRADEIEEAIVQQLRMDILPRIDAERLKMEVNQQRGTPIDEALGEQMKATAKELDREFQRSMMLFDRLTDGALSEEQYLAMNQKIRERIDSLTQIKAALERRMMHLEKSDTEPDVIELLHDVLSHAAITRESIRTLIKEIRISEEGLEMDYTWG